MSLENMKAKMGNMAKAPKTSSKSLPVEKHNISDLMSSPGAEMGEVFVAEPQSVWGKSREERVSYTLRAAGRNKGESGSVKRSYDTSGMPYIDGNGTLIIPRESGARRASVFESAQSGGSVLNLFGLKLCIPRYPLYRIHNFMSANPWHWACIEAKATCSTELGYQWKPKNEEGGKPRKSASQLKQLSDFESRIYETNHNDLATILKAVSTDFFSTGNYFLESALTPLGNIDSIYAVPAVSCFRIYDMPAVCQILPVDEWGLLPNAASLSIVESAMAVVPLFKNTVGNEKMKAHIAKTAYAKVFKPDSRFIHGFNPIISTDPFYGVADIIPALSAILSEAASNDYNLQFFQHNAVPRYAVLLKGGRVTEENKNHILRFLNESVLHNHHRTIVVPLGRGMECEFKPLDTAPNEASFLKLKEMSRYEILGAHRVPPTKVGIWDDANRSNGVQQAADFYNEVIRPYQNRIELLMNRIITEMGVTEYVFKFNNITWEDDRAQAQAQHVMALASTVRVQALVQAQQLVENLLNSNGIDETKAQALLKSLADRLETSFSQVDE